MGRVILSMLLYRGRSFVKSSEELLNKKSVFVSFNCSEIRQSIPSNHIKARFFLLVDLQEYFFRSRVGGTKKINKKALKMTS